MTIELLWIKKHGGLLTKQIWLEEGYKKDNSANCYLVTGEAKIWSPRTAVDFADMIADVRPNEAFVLGTLRDGHNESVKIGTKKMLNGAHYPGIISRSLDDIYYRPEKPAYALLDYDRKGMPKEVADRLEELGGFEDAITRIVPEIADTMRVLRASTSAGLFNSKTGEKLQDSGGMHQYVAVIDGADIARFIKTLHQRCWLAGLGWYIVGDAGQLLERSIIDAAVSGAERLCFEADPELSDPLEQDKEARRPIPIEGGLLDTKQACPPLTVVELSRLAEMMAKTRAALSDLRAKRRNEWVAKRVDTLVKEKGVAPHEARKTVESWSECLLLPDVMLEFDDPELAGTTVADILNDPNRFVGETLADPLEGVSYGRCKAKVLRRPNGEVFINSFAHGGAVYELKLDYRTVLAMLEQADTAELCDLYIRSVLSAHLNAGEIVKLRDLVDSKTETGKRVLDTMLKEARTERNKRQKQEQQEQRRAERQDPRPQIPAPASDAELLPVINTVTEVLLASKLYEPPMRDPMGNMVQIWTRKVPRLRLLTPSGANDEEIEDNALPAPEQATISRLHDPAVAELVERHVEFIVRSEAGERSVRLDPSYIKHFSQRQDDLPVVTAIATLPVVLDDGSLLTEKGLNRDHGTVFRIPGQLVRLLHRNSIPDDTEIAEAMRFLLEEWLVDVSADFAGKCILISNALTVIERVLLPERPAFFITAGMRGGGKTTVLNMVSLAIQGQRAAAAAWSKNEEERRKALFSYLLEGVSFLVWDNIEKGTLISCPHIEKALTADTFSDRVLGESRAMAPHASTVMNFTGNNIAPKGDMTSRSLVVRLPVNRPDPENRDFVHPDPFGWTLANRGKILEKLFTILIGNPRRQEPVNKRSPASTRFKIWWELVGSAVEHAAYMYQSNERKHKRSQEKPTPFLFKDQFITTEAADENVNALVGVLTKLNGLWPDGRTFDAKEVFKAFEDDGEFIRALEMAADKTIENFTPVVAGWRLKSIRDAVALIGEKSEGVDDQVTAILHHQPPSAQRNDPAKFWVEIIRR